MNFFDATTKKPLIWSIKIMRIIYTQSSISLARIESNLRYSATISLDTAFKP